MMDQEQGEFKGIALWGQSETGSLYILQSEKNKKASFTILCFD